MLVLIPAQFTVADLRPVSVELYQLMLKELDRLRESNYHDYPKLF